MRTLIKLLLIPLVTFIISSSAFALSLDEAKSKGMVGETVRGYLEAVAGQNEEVTALVKDINSKRKVEYQAIAQKNGTSLQAVELLAGKKAIEKTPAGQYVKTNGGWQKK